MDTQQLSKSLRDIRRGTGLTLREFCIATGLEALAWSRLERGLLPSDTLTDDEVLGKLPVLHGGNGDAIIEAVRTV